MRIHSLIGMMIAITSMFAVSFASAFEIIEKLSEPGTPPTQKEESGNACVRVFALAEWRAKTKAKEMPWTAQDVALCNSGGDMCELVLKKTREMNQQIDGLACNG